MNIMNSINYNNGDYMEEGKRSVLIITNDKNFTRHEIFSFYYFKKKTSKKLYAKMVEIFPVAGVNFFIFHVPLPEKIRKRHIEYLAQYISDLSKKIGAGSLFYHWGDNNCTMLQKYFCNKILNKSCAIHYDWFDIMKRYAKMQRVPLKKGNVVLICDHAQQAETIIKRIIREVYQIQICTKDPETFDEMIQWFLQEYGILLKVTDTLGSRYSEETLIISSSVDFNFCNKLTSESRFSILNISPYRNGLKNIYEDIFFTGDANIRNISEKCGGSNGEVLLFLFFSFCENHTEEEFRHFINDYGIKIMKIVKND